MKQPTKLVKLNFWYPSFWNPNFKIMDAVLIRTDQTIFTFCPEKQIWGKQIGIFAANKTKNKLSQNLHVCWLKLWEAIDS